MTTRSPIPKAENDLIAEVQQRERRNRHYAAGVFVISVLLAITLFIVIATNFPKWLGWCVLGMLLCACSWVWRPGIRSLGVSRIEAASLVDAALATKDRATSLAELEKLPSDTYGAQRGVVAKQLAALIPAGVTAAQIAPYVASQAERRAIAVGVVCVVALIATLFMRPRTPLDQLVEAIAEIEAAHPELPTEVHSALALLVEQTSDPRAESSDILQAISAAQSVLTNAAGTSSRPAVKDGEAAQQSSGERERSEKQSQRAEQTQTQDAKAGDPKGGESTGGEKQEPAQQGAKSQDQSAQDGAQSQDAGQSQQGEQGKKGEQGQQGQQGEEGQQGEQRQQQGEQGQAGSSGDNGTGAGTKGDGEGDPGSQPEPQGQQGAGQTGEGQQGQGQQESRGEGQKDDTGSSQQEGQQGQTGGSNKGAGKKRSDSGDESGEGSAREGIEKLQNALSKAKEALEPSPQGGRDKNQQGESPDTKGEAQDAAQEKKDGAGQKAAAEKSANQRSATKGEQGQDSKHEGKDAAAGQQGAGSQDTEKQGQEKEKQGTKKQGTESQGGKKQGGEKQGEEQQAADRQEREQQAVRGTPGEGSQDSTGGRSPQVDRNAKAREGGFDPNAPEGPGLGGKERFQEVQIEARDEDVDQRFTGQDLNPEHGDAVAQPKTTLEDLTLAKPKSVPHKGEQPIPLEYRDVLK